MRTRFVWMVLAAAAVSPPGAGAQRTPQAGGALPAFRSDQELIAFLSRREQAPPKHAAAQAAADPPIPCPSGPAPPSTNAAPAVLQGRVTNAAGQPEAAVLVRIACLDVGTTTAADGTYRLVVPGGRFAAGETAHLTAARVGLGPVTRTVTLAHGGELTQNFRLEPQTILLEDVVVTAAAGAVESVTNNQHAGVDEGGIVKVHGDYLVILRRGRLFTVRVGGGALEPVSAVDAFGPHAGAHAWYDELLVSGDNVVVVGYSYGRGGTELVLFHLDPAGRLHYRDTYHMRSADYYSSRNSASRLVGTRLVMYTPVPARNPRDAAAWMPALRRWGSGGEFRRILAPGRVYRPGRPLYAGEAAVLHTVTTCELARQPMQCESAAVLGTWGRVFYVSPTAVYVWTGGAPRAEGAPSMVYRLPLDGGAPRALRVEGTPVDQFSFLESEDGHLNVVVRSHAWGDGMWGAEFARGNLRLLRAPLRDFGDGRRAAPARAYRALPVPDAPGWSAFHNRFAGEHLLYGSGNGWGRPTAGGTVLYAVRWRDGRVAEIPLPHRVDRIEPMGGDAVVVGADTADLHFTGIRLDRRPRARQRYVQRGAQQGETRSHGFFYRADAPDEGVIGLPVRGPAAPGYAHLFQRSASVLFLQNRDAEFRPLGGLEARPEGEKDDGCIVSCVDWYGNARPLFLRGRILALMGYEIVEGAMDDGRIREVRRARFTPAAVLAAQK